MPQREIEKTKPDFDQKGLFRAREKTWEAVREIANSIHVGMIEEEAYEMAKSVLERLGATKHWHRPWVRFGPSTLHSYGIQSRPNVRLGANDIFFVDIGPIWDGYEGDAGDTFTTGSDAEMQRCAKDARELFDLIKERWSREKLSGAALYECAVQEAQKRGWIFNTRAASGHRLSDFPHAVYHKGNLASVDFEPSPYAWVLEIQIRHPEKDFGAFYEDLLF